MIAQALTPDDQMSVEELSCAVLQVMASRVEASNSLEQIVYRETELDEVWRLAHIALAEARSSGVGAGQWAEVLALVHTAHDLIGHHEDTIAAAAALRKAAALVP